jgi:two-component system, cell cycle response regulator
MTASILVVDDIEQNIKLLEAKLLYEYYTVYTATSGAEALEILDSTNIDVVLLDCMMPEMDGFDTCVRIKLNFNTSHIPVVLVTALSGKEDRIRGLEAGADEFLTKPIDDMALFARLKSLIRTKSIIDELKLRNDTNDDFGIRSSYVEQDLSYSKITIIDDDPVQSDNILQMLSSLTQNISIISDLKNLQTLLRQSSSADAMIISCQLEDHDPLRILATIKASTNAKNSSIIMLSEEEKISTVIKALDMGANDYFVIPLEQSELIARIKTQLCRKYYQDALRDDLAQGMNLSIKDALSNLYNRRYFEKYLERMIRKAMLEEKNLYAIMIDVDYFKNTNDEYGHTAGDKVIIETSNIIRTHVRAEDFITRYGGEEFVILLYDTTEIHSTDVAERLRNAIEAHDFILPNSTIVIHKTISIGVASYHNKESPSLFISRADEALYQAKRTGRNKVVFKR